jgi:two-component system, response regulator PdtaR
MRSLNVLVIEDDPLIALMLDDMLSEMGHIVCATAATELGATSAADRHRPDLMIADGRLRAGSGLSAVKKILLLSHVPCVFISGAPGDIVAQYPNAIVIRKPFNEDMLAAAIARALDPPPAESDGSRNGDRYGGAR